MRRKKEKQERIRDRFLPQRILNLVATKTQNRFQPTLATQATQATHQIVLLTHLEEMEYWYDWTFQGLPTTTGPIIQSDKTKSEFVVINSSRHRSTTERLDFTAILRLQATDLPPFAVAWQMIRFPNFCFLIQISIHYQAARLFL